MSAFGTAMLDQLQQPESNVTFRLSLMRDQGINCPCQDFIHLHHWEEELLRSSLQESEQPRVLDIGCGIGRHSRFIHTLSPEAAITVVEKDRELRTHVLNAIPNAVGYEQITDIPADARFDIALLLGNGLGICGTENATRELLQRLHAMLSKGGCALIESGNFAAGEFYTAYHKIVYKGLIDEPFPWGYATQPWLERELAAAGFSIVSSTPSHQNGLFFIIHAARID